MRETDPQLDGNVVSSLADPPPSACHDPAQRTRPRRRRLRIARLLQLNQYDPCRSVDWRWRLAGELVRDRRRVPRSQDSMLAEASAFRRVLEAGGKRTASTRLAKRWPALFHAHRLHLEEGKLRTVIEARLLAKQSPAEIASLHGLTLAVVEAFALLFFDVADRLQARDYILAKAIGSAWTTGEADDATLLRGFAYYGGPLALDAVAGVLDTAGLPIGAQLGDLQTAEGRLQARTWLAVAARSLPLSPQLATEIGRIRDLIIRLERDDEGFGAATGRDSMLKHCLTAALPVVTNPLRDGLERAECVSNQFSIESAENESAWEAA